MKDQLFQDHVATSEKKTTWAAGFSEDVEAMAKSLGARVVFEGAGYAGYLRERWVSFPTEVEDTYWVFRGEKFASSSGPHKIALDQAAEFRRLLASLGIDHPGVLPGEAPLRDSSKEPAPPVFSDWAQSLAKLYGARVVFETEGLVAGLLRLKIKGLDYWVFATGPDRIAYSTTGHQIGSAQAQEFRLLLSKIGIVYPGVIPGEEPPNGVLDPMAPVVFSFDGLFSHEVSPNGGVESPPPPDPPSTPELRNVVAELLHRKWSKDIKDVLCLATPSPDGGFTIAVEKKVDVLQRSMDKYQALAAQHKQPNLAMADQIIAAVREYDREISEHEAPLVIEEEPAPSPTEAEPAVDLDLHKLLADLALEFLAEAMEEALDNAVLDPDYRWVISKERSKQIGNLLTYAPDEVDVMGLSFGARAHGTASRLQRLKKRSLKADKPIIFMPGDGDEDIGVFDEISNQMADRIIDTLAKHDSAATEYWRNPGGVPPRAEEPAPTPAEELGWKESLLEVVDIIGSITRRSPGLGCEFQDHIGISLDSLRDRLTP